LSNRYVPSPYLYLSVIRVRVLLFLCPHRRWSLPLPSPSSVVIFYFSPLPLPLPVLDRAYTYVTMPTKFTSPPRFDFGFGFASMPLLSSFFSILDLALVLALLSNTIALSIAKRQALLYLSVSFHSFGCLSPFVYHLLSFSFLLSPCTNHNFTISQPHRSIYLSSHPSSPLSTHPRSSRPYDENSAPRLACIPSLRFALFSFSLFG